jgi:hypothetical protein
LFFAKRANLVDKRRMLAASVIRNSYAHRRELVLDLTGGEVWRQFQTGAASAA